MKYDKKTIYNELNSKQKENYNYVKLASELADLGFNCLRLDDDWNGADFIAIHQETLASYLIQLKGRMYLDDSKYGNKNLYLAFPIEKNDRWVIVEYDELIKLAPESWGKYHEVGKRSVPSTPKKLINPIIELSIVEPISFS